MRLLTSIVTLTLAASASAATKTSTATSAPSTPELLHVSGALGARGGTIVYVSPGVLITEGVRVYSEPSHTLLSAVIDSTFSATGEGKAWLRRLNVETPHAWLTTVDLGGARMKIGTRAEIPSADRRLVAYATSVWPDGGAREKVVVDATMQLADFNVTTYEPESSN
ncbi:MAG: hypothetical protein ABI321_12815 [Polyangia bacterium]